MNDLEQKWNLQVQPQYASRNLWEALAVKEGLGYEVLELSAPFVTERDLCRQWYRGTGRVVSVHGAFIDINPASMDAGIFAVSRQRCHESCMLARSLGAGHVIFHSSCETFLRGLYMDRWAGRCASFYESLSEQYDLRIWIENSQDMDAGPISELMKRTTDPRVGVCLDIGHVNYSRMPMEQWFDILGDRIGYLHLSDNNGLYDDHLPLGEGTVNWAEADALWRSTGRKMLLTLEVGATEGVMRSIRYLKEHGYFGF